MDPRIVDKLRRDQALHDLPDGREGIDVTLQFVGAVPTATRGDRRHWLARRFSSIQGDLGQTLALKPDSLSVSAQSIEAVVPVEDFDTLEDQLSRHDVRVNATRTVNVLERG